mgnify:CR=1 FL=1
MVQMIKKKKVSVIFDKTKPSGDKTRVLNVSKAKKYKIYKVSNFEKTINQTILWYKENKKQTNLRFTYFK